jgi:diadenosine tetraphosphate (Ap4A) HIT family hydrolase
MCAEGRPAVDAAGNVRFFSGSVCDAYLQREAPSPGYTTVRWRGRHVADPSEMSEEERSAFWTEVAIVARAITRAFAPGHLNYDVLGNLVPHVHVHIVPRYLDDACPNMPLKPWLPVPVDAEVMHTQVEQLAALLANDVRR